PSAWGAAGTCCPDEATVVDVHRRRVKEYFPLLRPHDEGTSPSLPSQCAVCRDGVPIHVATSGSAVAHGTGSSAPSWPTGGGSWHAGSGGTVPTPPAPPAPTTVVEDPLPAPVAPPPVAVAPEAPKPPVARVAAPPPSPAAPAAAGHLPPRYARAYHPAPLYVRPPAVRAAGETHPVKWLLTLVIVGLALQAAMRPLRRLLTVRHLGHPLW